jgi:hypothetical protein
MESFMYGMKTAAIKTYRYEYQVSREFISRQLTAFA